MMSALDKIILIVGCPRSGLAMSAGIIGLCGAFGGKMRVLPGTGKRELFENEDICEHILEPYLRSIGADPRGQKPLPSLDDLIPVADLKQKIEEFLYAQHYDGGQAVFFKSPLTALVWPLFHRAFPAARWVVVRRADQDIIYSCMHTGFMNAYRTKQGWRYCMNVYKRRFAEMQDAGLDVREIWPTKFVEGDFTEMQACIKWLGLKWDDQAVKDFICPELFYRNEVNDGS